MKVEWNPEKLKEMLESVLCDPAGLVCIQGSAEDRRILQDALAMIDAAPKGEGETVELEAQCLSVSGGSPCTLRKGHDGEHQAWVNGVCIWHWPDKPKTVKPCGPDDVRLWIRWPTQYQMWCTLMTSICMNFVVAGGEEYTYAELAAIKAETSWDRKEWVPLWKEG